MAKNQCCHGDELLSRGNGENGVEWMGKGLHQCEAPETPPPPDLHIGGKAQLSLGQMTISGNTGWLCFP